MKSTWHRWPLLVLPLLLLGACADGVIQKNAERYYDAGLAAERVRDYVTAEELYRRAFINARDGHSPAAGRSAAMYSWGRMAAANCKTEEGKRLLQNSLDLELTVALETENVAKRLFELARLTQALGQPAESADYYRRALPIVAKLGAEDSDPISFAEAYEDYATVLRQSGQEAAAATPAAEAAALRARHPNRNAMFRPQRYTNCSH